MAIGSFKLEKLFAVHFPRLIMFCHGSQKALFKQKRQKWVDVGLQKRLSMLSTTSTQGFGGKQPKESERAAKLSFLVLGSAQAAVRLLKVVRCRKLQIREARTAPLPVKHVLWKLLWKVQMDNES